MTEMEFARFIKKGLGTPVASQMLATRIAAEVAERSHSSDVHGSTLLRPRRAGVVVKTDKPGRSQVVARRVATRIGAAALALGLIAALNLGVVYYFPRYGTALASVPVVGGVSRSILAGAGLASADVAAVSDVSTSNGHTLRLVGVYADGLQTVFLIQIDNQSLAAAGPPTKTERYLVAGRDATLTDQFGHTYQRVGSPSGDQRPVAFSPLVAPAAQNGARLTLHLRNLDNVGTAESIPGEWTLHATVFEHAAHVIPLPAPIELGGNTFTFTSIKSATVFELSWKVTGPGVAQAWNVRDQGSFARLRPYVPSFTGLKEIASGVGFTFDPSTNSMYGQITEIWESPGKLTIRFGSPEIGLAERTIVVPKN